MNRCMQETLKLPCGMGKSLIMIYHMMLHGKTSIILVPNIALVEQFHNNTIRYYSSFNHSLPEIHRISTVNKEFEIQHPELQQIMIIVYASFKQFFIDPLLNHHNCNFASNDIRKFKRIPYLYIDEAHHILNPSNKTQNKTIEELYNSFNKIIPNADIIINSFKSDSDSNSHTTVIPSSSPSSFDTDENPSFDDVLTSINSVSKAYSSLIYAFAYTFCDHYYFFSATIKNAYSQYTLFSAIDEDYLCRLNIELLINSQYGKREIPAQNKIQEINKLIKNSRYLSIIIYCNRISTARTLNRNFEFSSAVVTSQQSSGLRESIFADFRAHKIRALITVNCISEGMDLPEADACIFYDDRKSSINIIQCVGRIMRKSNAKCSSTLIYPAYADDDINYLCQNILKVVNGELGYGSIDLRRILRIHYSNFSINNENDKAMFKNIRQKVNSVIFEYNKEIFNNIDMYDKLEWCKSKSKISNKRIPGIDYEVTEKDEKTILALDYIKAHIYNDNKAGYELRRIFGIVLIGPHKPVRVPQLNYNTSDEEYNQIIHDVWMKHNS